MNDFTLVAYKQYLQAIKFSFENILRFDEFFASEIKPDSFCIIRHDVDRKPENALHMARLENEMGVTASYYFRAKKHTFNKRIIQEIRNLRHEIGYHYECLSDTNGCTSVALRNFKTNLNKFREIVPVSTIVMHGRPFSRHDNLDMWRRAEDHSLLGLEFKILGEIYLDMDYTNIVYITDTGRNWSSEKSNKRDKVQSNRKKNFKNRNDLLAYLRSCDDPKIIFQVHPERWTDSPGEYCVQWCKDKAINIIKAFL